MKLKFKVRNQAKELGILQANNSDLSRQLRQVRGLVINGEQIIEEQLKIIQSPEYMVDGMSLEERGKLILKYCRHCFRKVEDPECCCNKVSDPEIWTVEEILRREG